MSIHSRAKLFMPEVLFIFKFSLFVLYDYFIYDAHLTVEKKMYIFRC